jgi:hypothetical protein
MSDFLMFVQWQWRRFDWGERLIILSFIPIVASPFIDKPWGDYLWTAGVGICLAVATKWIIWDRVAESYAKYKKQRDGLFNEIRGE